MTIYARIDNGVVVEFFTTNDPITKYFPPTMTWVDVSDVTGIAQRWTATETNGAWTFAAPVPKVLPLITKISPLTFKGRFTSSEWSGILTAATTDPTVLGWVFEASAAKFIDLNDANTTLGLTYLSTRNPSLLDATRIPVLLTASSTPGV